MLTTRLFAHKTFCKHFNILKEFIVTYKRESSRRKWKSCSRMRRPTAKFETSDYIDIFHLLTTTHIIIRSFS